MTAALLGLLLAAAPAGSAQSQARPRTLAQLVRLALAHGRDHTLTDVGAAALGLNKAPTPLKSLESGGAPDGSTRAFSVAYNMDGGRRIPASVILWRTEQGPRARPELRSRNRSFLADLKGRLACVYENQVGLDGASQAIQKPKPGPDDRHDFLQELDFWLHVAIPADRSQEGLRP
jgi:hypothetical protein